MTYVRKMMEDERGFTDDQWKKMAELGWMGLILPEQYGGAGLNIVDLVVVLEEMGRVVCPGRSSPPSILGGVAHRSRAAATAQKQALPARSSPTGKLQGDAGAARAERALGRRRHRARRRRRTAAASRSRAPSSSCPTRTTPTS